MKDELQPTNMLPSPPPKTDIELPTMINTATRKRHAELNRLIIERLPLALPLNADNPAILGHGLAVFARIYYSFEAAWKELLRYDEKEERTDAQSLRHALVNLHIDRLCRTNRLKDDLDHIAAITGERVHASLEEQQRPLLNSIISGICAKPHTIIAYAWVMYMAIFSGGRWIRAQLASAEPKFWTEKTDIQHRVISEKSIADVDGFSFLQFDGDRDGEDIKEEFKLRLKAADEVLTAAEKDDVVDAAITLFDDCITMVLMLDSDMQRRKTTPIWSWAVFGITGAVATLLRIFGKAFTNK